MDDPVLPFGACYPFAIFVGLGKVYVLLRGKRFVVGLFKIRCSKGPNVVPRAENFGFLGFLPVCKPVGQT